MSVFITECDGMTLEECATVLDCSVSAVYDAERRALEKLRRRPEALKKLVALVGELARHRGDENGLCLRSGRNRNAKGGRS